MSRVEPIPRVVVALDTGFQRAQEILEITAAYDRSEVGVQVRASFLHAHGDTILDLARRRNRFAGVNTHITDGPKQQAQDIDNWLVTETSTTQDSRPLPSAINVEPAIDDDGINILREPIARAARAGVAVIGTPPTYRSHRADTEYFGRYAIMADRPASRAGFDALEVIYGGLYFLHAHRQEKNHNEFMKQVIVSKPSWYEKDIEIAADHAFKLGGTTLLLGSSVVGDEVQYPAEPIEKALQVAARYFD